MSYSSENKTDKLKKSPTSIPDVEALPRNEGKLNALSQIIRNIFQR